MSAGVTTGYVVAGGRSSRMGSDKARLPWGGTTLIEHACARLRGACGEVRLLTGATPRYAELGLPIDLDALLDAGPLAGVLAGLERLAPDEVGLFLALDLPHVPSGLLTFLVEACAGWDAVVPVTPRGPEPLCASYRASCAASMRARLQAGERRMTCFWPDVRVCQVGPEALISFGDPARLFTNLNTPEEYARDA